MPSYLIPLAYATFFNILVGLSPLPLTLAPLYLSSSCSANYTDTLPTDVLLPFFVARLSD